MTADVIRSKDFGEHIVPDYLLPIETRLVRVLRRYLDDIKNAGGPSPAESGIVDEIWQLLEWFIGDCLQYATCPSLRGQASDGVADLEVQQHGQNRVCLRGVAWLMSREFSGTHTERLNRVDRNPRSGTIHSFGSERLTLFRPLPAETS